jgi:hypothetical protein
LAAVNIDQAASKFMGNFVQLIGKNAILISFFINRTFAWSAPEVLSKERVNEVS